jgi:hypothetical protein
VRVEFETQEDDGDDKTKSSKQARNMGKGAKDLFSAENLKWEKKVRAEQVSFILVFLIVKEWCIRVVVCK